MAKNSSLYELKRPARYIGGERGSIAKDWDKVDVTFALAFPDVYEIGMSHIGSAILYRALNDTAWIAAERSYTPWPDREAQLRSDGKLLSSLESDRNLADHRPRVQVECLGLVLTPSADQRSRPVS